MSRAPIATLSVDRFAARFPRLEPGREYTCPNCRQARFSAPNLCCPSCQQEPRFAAAVDAFNTRQAARRQERAS